MAALQAARHPCMVKTRIGDGRRQASWVVGAERARAAAVAEARGVCQTLGRVIGLKRGNLRVYRGAQEGGEQPPQESESGHGAHWLQQQGMGWQ